MFSARQDTEGCSVALEEMGKELKNQGRKSVLGIKIAAKHTLITTLSNIIYEDKPGPEEEKVIKDAVERVISIVRKYGKMYQVQKMHIRMPGRSFAPDDKSVTGKISRADVADFMLRQISDTGNIRKAVSLSN